MHEHLKTWRRELHQIPEIAFDLFLTHDYVKGVLTSLGYQTETVAKTGLIAIKKGLSDEAIAFRSDMDALPVKELTGVPFLSKHDGNMHACGHDGHMAMLLGFAKYLSGLSQLKKTVVLIFQPAEEGPGGAKVIIEEGVFERYKIKQIFGIHLYPELKEGLYGLVNGPMMAQNGEFNITIHGISAHGAQPHMGSDAILAASALIQNYHTIVSRYLNPLEPAVVTIGTITGGEARNILSKEVKLTGTIRSFNQETYEAIKRRMKAMDEGISMSYGVRVESEVIDYYPAVNNDEQLFELLKSTLPSSSYKIIPPMMFAEDFAFYQKKVPGMFVMLGTRNESLGYTHPLHSCYFNFDEHVLIKGVELYQHILKVLAIV